MSLLGSWWSGKPSSEGEGEGEDKPDSWVGGLGSLVRNVGGYAASLGETVKSKVQDTPFIGEFQAEQEKFEKEQRRQKDAAVPPWVGYNEEELMKVQILQLSADSRNVLRNPPPGVQFHFDFEKTFPVAMAILKEDSRLQKLRFELVPKKVTEEKFWHNYFYRVFLIKQSSQLSSLAQAEQKGTLAERPEEVRGSEVRAEGEREKEETLTETFHVESDIQSPQEEFASDALHPSEEISRESIKAELGQLGVPSSPDKGKEWEAELQAELRDLELQGISLGEGEGEGVASQEESETWEEELQQMLDFHSDPTKD